MQPHQRQKADRIAAHQTLAPLVRRRTFLVASGLGFCGWHLPDLLAGESRAAAAPGGKAKSTILIWLSGGVSHLDTFDLKPQAPAEYRGEFQAIETSAPGVRLCEHLPHLAKQAHRLAVINSLGHFRRGTGDHHAGYYYNLTGHAPDQSFRTLGNNRTPQPTDWPFIGAVVGRAAPPHPYLPQVISLPQKPGAPRFTRPGQFAARLGVEHDPLYVLGDVDHPTQFTTPALSLAGDVTPGRLQSRRELLRVLDSSAQSFDRVAATTAYSSHQQKAFSLLSAARSKNAFDLSAEPAAVREKYGTDVNAMSMLLARRLVEAGVPFVSVFWQSDPKLAKKCRSAGSWDTHGNNFQCLKENLLPTFDQPFSALLDDLSERGLLDQTLVMVNSEMGRKPKVGDPRSGGVRGAGRDHWTHCMSVLLAGGGIRGGQTYGASDRVGEFPAERPVAPEDITQTLYHLMGIHDPVAIDRQGRPVRLMDQGAPLLDLL